VKIIGLTGGIGSGKSTLLKWFESKGIPCFESDAVGKELLNNKLRRKISLRFGSELYSTGTLNRSVLAKKVFQNPQELEALNQIVHPEVVKSFEVFKSKHSNAPLIVKEAAILFETGGNKTCDVVLLVTSPKETRVQRILERDGGSEADVLSRMKNQWSDERKKGLADWVIENKDLSSLEEQAEAFLEHLRK